ncbi:hypothetical protein M0813_11972 [Anaeramoeba flamelloides]|uniref:Uncharacterized protein n=1 Tax=Anaeramoeba flamelloides TaxID=1746091 RepID=A0ABQ8ZE02_9EUKA|nr:hypothetical protein M0813_11972 [Anaeramoeba flamelloides]
MNKMSSTKSTTSIRARTKTKNQLRIESLIRNSPNSVKGITLEKLGLPNCPQKIKVASYVLRSSHKKRSQKQKIESESVHSFSKKELILFMMKKFNLFYDPILTKETKKAKKDSKFSPKMDTNYYLIFRNYQAKGIDSVFRIIDSEDYENKTFRTLNRKLSWWKKNDSKAFVGLDVEHTKEWFQPPSKVSILKAPLKQFCLDSSATKKECALENLETIQGTTNTSQSSEIKKLYRALTFFFKARFNWVNTSNKSRKKMKFGRNYKFGCGDSHLKKFGLCLSEKEKTTNKSKSGNGENGVGKCKSKYTRKNYRKRKMKKSKPNKTVSAHKQSKSQKKMRSFQNLNQETRHRSAVNRKKPQTEMVLTGSSSGEETEREDFKHFNSPIEKNKHNIKKRKLTKMIVTKKRNKISSNAFNEQSYFEQLKFKSDNELEGELLSLLLMLKHGQK